MGLFDLFKKKAAPPVTDPSRPSADALAQQLETLGYFRYADAADLQRLRTEIAEGLANEQYLPFVSQEPPRYESLDLRHYFLDGEDLFECGGVTDALKEMSPFFERAGIRMVVTNHLEEGNANQVSHRLTLNGKEYILFDNFEGYGWGEAAQRFADMVNDQLRLQQSPEQLYLISGGNDGRAVFLTAELHELIAPLIKDVNEKPLPTREWCKVGLVAYHPVV